MIGLLYLIAIFSVGVFLYFFLSPFLRKKLTLLKLFFLVSRSKWRMKKRKPMEDKKEEKEFQDLMNHSFEVMDKALETLNKNTKL